VNNCVDVTEVWGLLNQKKITIKDLTGENPEGPKPTFNTPPKPDHPARGAPSPEDEKKADAILRSARLFKDSDEEYYKGKLKAIVSKYPETAAGKEAKKLLDAPK
jgi:hypothetical protein